MEVGEGFWVKFVVQAVAPTSSKPHGIDYSLCLFSPDDVRLVCFDNAHPVKDGPGRHAKRTSANDHMHDGCKVVPYAYEDAEKLMSDFWAAVEEVLEKYGANGA